MKEKIAKVLSFEKTKKSWRHKRDSPEFKAATSLNYHFFGVHLSTGKCNCVEDLFFFLKNAPDEIINQKQKQMNSNFKLKSGIMLALHGFDPINNTNLTDEKAIELLAKYPGHKVSFETMPENVDELIAKQKAASKKAVSKVSQENTAGPGSITDDKVKFLSEKTVAELKELCAPYPEEEWKKMNKAKLVEYLIGKTE